MKKLQLRGLTRRFATLGIMGIMAIGALIPATAFAASIQSTKCTAGDTQCVITAGNALISGRLSALNTLNAQVTADLGEKKITSSQASTLQADISTNESGLNALKTKLDAETVAKNARQDVSNMYLQFRIYAVVLPRDARNLLLDVETNAQQVMSASIPAIQAAISKAPSGQQSQLNTLFSDYQKQVSDAQSQFPAANQDIPQMTPQAFNQNRTAYETVRKNLDTSTHAANKDLHQAASDLQQIVKILGHDI